MTPPPTPAETSSPAATSVDVVMELAQATLKPGRVLLIDANNERAGYADQCDAIASRGAFAGDLRDGVIALDCDSREAVETWARVAASALKEIGCTIVRVASGRPGHEHLFAVGPVGWTSELLAAKARAAGAPGEQVRHTGQDVRPPLSPHRLGLRVAMVEPADAPEAKRRLTGRPGQTAWDSGRWAHVHAHGNSVDHIYKTHSAAVMALAVAAVNADVSFDYFKRWLHASPALGEKANQQGGRWLAETWRKAQHWVREHPPAAKRSALVGSILATAYSYPWPGRRERDRWIYTYLAEYAAQVGGDELAKDQRSIALATGIPHGTVNAALKRLRRDGFIEILEHASGGQATRYKLLPKIHVGGAIAISGPPVREVASCSAIHDFDTLPDLFRGFLPQASFDTWRAMPPDTWVKTKEVAIARRGAMKPATILSHLNALHSAGLVDRRSHRWLYHAEDRRGACADGGDSCTAGAAGTQDLQIERERDLYRLWRGNTTADHHPAT